MKLIKQLKSIYRWFKKILSKWGISMQKIGSVILLVFLFLFLLAGIGISLWMIATGNPTSRESILLSLFLTILSVIGSWIASKYYGEVSFNKNLKVFALKASEKVNNLSNELDRLSVYLQQELETNDYDNLNEAILSKDNRIESAIHIISTLKSVNDRSLSDWQGVIGDEIKAQREKQEEREEDLKELLNRAELLYSSHIEDILNEQGQNTTQLQNEIKDLESNLRMITSQIGGIPFKRFKREKKSQYIETENLCPKCKSIIHYKQRPKENSFCSIICQTCGNRLISHYTGDGFILKTRIPIREQVSCPSCLDELFVELDPMPGSCVETCCPSCKIKMRVFRTPKDVGVRPMDSTSTGHIQLSDDVIEKVRCLLPPQPWPKGIHKDIAEKLGYPIHIVSSVITKLIHNGVFLPQINGQIFYPLKGNSETSVTKEE